jgi:hypothetical protein
VQSDLLHVVTAISNPIRWKSRNRLYKEFEAHMLDSGVRLTTVECAYGDIPHALDCAPEVNHVQVYGKTQLWIKENLLNIGIQRLPRDWKYAAWIDADIFFRKKEWASETVYALQHHDIVQPWEHCYDLGPNDEHLMTHNSFARQWVKDPITTSKLGKGYTFAHPGYAWAATRGTLEKTGGLLEVAALGAADHHMALAILGKAHLSLPGGMHPNYTAAVKEWERRAMAHLGQNLGFVHGTIEHRWHGDKAARKYISRWDILKKHQFDPIADLKRNVSGVFELIGNKPEFKRDLMQYFASRNEDINALV